MVEKERKPMGSLQTNMMSVLVKASDDEKNATRNDAKSKLHLSEDEVTEIYISSLLLGSTPRPTLWLTLLPF